MLDHPTTDSGVGATPGGVARVHRLVERVTTDVDVLVRLAASVSERNPDAFRALIDQLDLASFAHLLCHWACTVHGYLLCELVCSPEPVPRVPLVEALAEVGPVLRALRADPQAFSAAASAASDNDCDGLRAAISAVGIADECEVICQWFCTWTCMSVCLLLCRVFPFTPIEDPVLEAFQFAASTTRLASQPGLVTRLATAVGARDAKQFESIVVELKLQQFCIQLCHWVCALRCHVFCHCVCPPLTEAFFTHIGALGYADPTVVASQANGSGLTVADNRALFQHASAERRPFGGGRCTAGGVPLRGRPDVTARWRRGGARPRAARCSPPRSPPRRGWL